jgi:hypothetical protein
MQTLQGVAPLLPPNPALMQTLQSAMPMPPGHAHAQTAKGIAPPPPPKRESAPPPPPSLAAAFAKPSVVITVHGRGR